MLLNSKYFIGKDPLKRYGSLMRVGLVDKWCAHGVSSSDHQELKTVFFVFELAPQQDKAGLKQETSAWLPSGCWQDLWPETHHWRWPLGISATSHHFLYTESDGYPPYCVHLEIASWFANHTCMLPNQCFLCRCRHPTLCHICCCTLVFVQPRVCVKTQSFRHYWEATAYAPWLLF